MCSHSHTFRTTHNTVVCVCCGIERGVPLTIVQSQPVRDMCPFPTGYSKLKRFTKILDCVLFPTPTTADEQMLSYLHNRKFDSLEKLLLAMKHGKMRDKRYTSIHLLTKLFVTTYTPPQGRDYMVVRAAILRAFETIEFTHWKVCPNEPFFNYNYLLCVLLVENGLGDLVRYVKNLRCKRRRSFYKKQLIRLRANGFTNAYSVLQGRVDVLKTRKPISQQLGDHPKHRGQKRSLSEIGESLLRLCRQDQIGETLFGFVVSCPRFRVSTL